MTTMTKTAGLGLAVAAASLFAAGCSSTPMSNAGGSSTVAAVHCAGVNSCKGQSACKTANNACKGQNSCKGQGFVDVSASECSAKGGKVMQM